MGAQQSVGQLLVTGSVVSGLVNCLSGGQWPVVSLALAGSLGPTVSQALGGKTLRSSNPKVSGSMAVRSMVFVMVARPVLCPQGCVTVLNHNPLVFVTLHVLFRNVQGGSHSHLSESSGQQPRPAVQGCLVREGTRSEGAGA